MKIIGRMAIFPTLPERLSRLYSIANNLWWMWNPQAQSMFRLIDPDLWEKTRHNAIRLISESDPKRLQALTRDPAFLALYDLTLQNFDTYMQNPQESWYHNQPEKLPGPIVYFSAEFGMHESLPIYSGGLGILAGDHNKETSDLGLPFIGIGFLYPQGYFLQRITRTGDQEAIYERLNFADLPAEVARDPQGNEAKISVDLTGRRVFARIWKFNVGRNALYLLDTDVEENDPRDRILSARLYGGDHEIRIAQEIVLGIGGVRALQKLGIQPSVWHLNESHSAFVSLERARQLIENENISFYESLKVVAGNSVFTTHTPVPAGNDAFSLDLMDRYFSNFWPSLRISRDEFLQFARQDLSWGPTFSMTVLALKTTSIRNGVSKLHGAVSRRMWQFLWPQLDVEETPIGHITNGVHSPTWTAAEMDELYRKYISADWQEHVDDEQMWRAIDTIPDQELWNTHTLLRNKMIDFARRRHAQRSDRLGEGSSLLPKGKQYLQPNALTIGFARRFATYKRAALLFRDKERLLSILNNPTKPAQFIFAGKAHPADEPGKSLIKQIEHYTRDPDFAGKVIILEEYDMDMARHLVAGVDMWLNNPIRPYEASGTSGQKAGLNGVPNCSVLDGWWDEGFNGHNGWAIGDDREYLNSDMQDYADSESLYAALERQIIPTFYETDENGVPHAWVKIMKESIRTVGPQFSMRRMVKEYFNTMYVPAARHGAQMEQNHFQTARELTAWENRVRAAWPQLAVDAHGPHDGQLGVGISVQVTASAYLADLSPDDVAVELIWGKDDNGRLQNPRILRMEHTEQHDGRHSYTMQFIPDCNGSVIYGVRIRPAHWALQNPNELGLMLWAQ